MAEGRAVGSTLQHHGSLAAELPASRLPARTTSTPAPGALSVGYEQDEGPQHPGSSSKYAGELLQSQDSPDARRRVYREIHGLQDSYSECGTPPAIDIEFLAKDFDANLPLGPLSPSPLSPSLLTLCNGFGQLDKRGGGKEAPSRALPDLRDTPPLLRQCESPQGLPR